MLREEDELRREGVLGRGWVRREREPVSSLPSIKVASLDWMCSVILADVVLVLKVSGLSYEIHASMRMTSLNP